MSSDLPRLNEKLNRRDQVCRGCNRRGDKFKRKNHFTRVTSSYIQRLNQSKLFSFQFNKGDFLCFNCRVNFRLKCDTSEQRVSRGEVQVVQSTSLSPTLIFRNSTRNNFTRSGQLGVQSDATVTKSQPITVSPSITFRCSTRNKRKPRKFSPSEKRVQGGEHPFVSSQSTFMSPTLTFWNSNRKKRNLSKSDAGLNQDEISSRKFANKENGIRSDLLFQSTPSPTLIFHNSNQNKNKKNQNKFGPRQSRAPNEVTVLQSQQVCLSPEFTIRRSKRSKRRLCKFSPSHNIINEQHGEDNSSVLPQSFLDDSALLESLNDNNLSSSLNSGHLTTSTPRCEITRCAPTTSISSPPLPIAFLENSGDYCDKSSNDLSFINTIDNDVFMKPTTGDSIELEMNRTIFAHNQCIVCREPEHKGMKRITYSHASSVFYARCLIVKPGTRACAHHFDSNSKLLETSIDSISVESKTTILSARLISRYLQEIHKHRPPRSVYWEHFRVAKKVPEDVCKDITGFDSSEFQRLVQFAKQNGTMRDNKNRTVSQAMAVFLYRLKSGVAQNEVRRLFGLKSRQRVSDYFISVLKALHTNMVPKFFGLGHLTREELYSHMTDAAKVLCEKVWKNPNAMITIYDGSYFYIQKSGDHEYQRRTYSEHKHKNLLKPFLMVAPDGYIVGSFGLYLGKDNDAKIMNDLFFENKDIAQKMKQLIKPGDILTVDRGFRDIKAKLKEAGYFVKMPSCKLNTKEPKRARKRLSEAEKQKSREKQRNRANKSRFVTKLRWVVEMVNGHLKSRFKLLDGTIHNRSLKYLQEIMEVAAALYNFNFRPVIADGKFNKEMALRMVDRFNWSNNNEIMKFADQQAQKRREWEPKLVEMETNVIQDFPRMSPEDIYMNITFGQYQLRQGLQYIKQHQKKDNGKYKISMFSKDSYIRAQIQSRFSGQKVRNVYIKYDKDKTGYDGILGWFCDCPNGARTVGCCGHVASLIYFLAYAQHLPTLPKSIKLNLEELPYDEETIVWFQDESHQNITNQCGDLSSFEI